MVVKASVPKIFEKEEKKGMKNIKSEKSFLTVTQNCAINGKQNVKLRSKFC